MTEKEIEALIDEIAATIPTTGMAIDATNKLKRWVVDREDLINHLRVQNQHLKKQIRRLQKYGMAMDKALERLDTLAADIRADAVKNLGGGDLVPPDSTKGPSNES